MLFHPPNLDYINTPVLMMQAAAEMQYGNRRGEILPPALIELLRLQAEQNRAEAAHVALHLKPTAAKKLLPKMRQSMIKFFQDRDRFEADFAYAADTESYRAFVDMFDSVQELVGEIAFAAANRKVDEDLFAQIMMEKAAHGKPVAGQAAVMALFA